MSRADDTDDTDDSCVTDIEAGIDVDVPCKPSILKSNYNHIFCELLDKGSSAN